MFRLSQVLSIVLVSLVSTSASAGVTAYFDGANQGSNPTPALLVRAGC